MDRRRRDRVPLVRHETLETLKALYIELAQDCKKLEELKRREETPIHSSLAREMEELRMRLASHRVALWQALREEVWIEWLNDNNLPDVFASKPPKDIPRR
jgi:hypothetical protein